MTRPVAALTGATGFLGRRLARALHGAGYRLRVLARSPGAAFADLDPEVVVGRLADADALDRLAEGADVVIHAAGLIKARSLAGFLAVNAAGARAMAEATARRAPGARFILVSSLTAREPGLSPYAASKAAGEAAVRERLDPARLTIVRPPAVYGPGDRETLALFQAAQTLPVLPLPAAGHARFALVHVDDAAAQIAALAGRAGDGQTWVLTDDRPEGYGWREMFEAAARAVGRRPRLIRAPGALLLAAGAANSLIGRLGGAPRIMTLGKAREMLHGDWGASPHELAPDSPPPRFGLDAGFADAVLWYRAQGWLKGQSVSGASPGA